MRKGSLSVIVSLSVVMILGSAPPTAAQFYTQHNLVSDGFVPADHSDPNMANAWGLVSGPDRKSTRLNSSHLVISYAAFCLKKKNRPFYQSSPYALSTITDS